MQVPSVQQLICDCSRIFLTQAELLTHLQDEMGSGRGKVRAESASTVAQEAVEQKEENDDSCSTEVASVDHPRLKKQKEEEAEVHWAWLGPDLRIISVALAAASPPSPSAAQTDTTTMISCRTCAFATAAHAWRAAAAVHDARCPHPDLGVDGAAPLSSFALRCPAVPSMLHEVPVSERASCFVMFQCPDCSFIFLSWARMEKHLTQSRHGLRFCRDCNAHLNPRGQLQARDHKDITGHSDFLNEHRSKKDYEVVVNRLSPGMKATVDVPIGAVYTQTLNERICFQCPAAPRCWEIFTTMPELEEHFRVTRHNVMFCRVCQDWVKITSPHRSGIVTHAHPVRTSDTNVELQQQRAAAGEALASGPAAPAPVSVDEEAAGGSLVLRPGDDFRVVTSNEELLQCFGHRFTACPVCNVAVEISRREQHIRSTACDSAVCRTQWLQQQQHDADKGKF